MATSIPTADDFAPVDGRSRGALKQRLVEAYMHNPFRDDDAQILSARLGASRAEIGAALRELCGDRLLRPAAERGYMLDAAGLEQTGAVSAAAAASTDGETGASAGGAASNPAAAEVSKAFANFQEELFGQLRADVIEPLLVIRDFLDNQDPRQLGLARAALEQIYWAVRELGLAGADLDQSEDDDGEQESGLEA